MIDISSHWLRAQTTVEEIEAERWKTKPNKGEPVRPQTARWIAFKTQIRAGDEVWRYSSPPDSWVGMIGTAGSQSCETEILWRPSKPSITDLQRRPRAEAINHSDLYSAIEYSLRLLRRLNGFFIAPQLGDRQDFR
jgi:hypothetical protein